MPESLTAPPLLSTGEKPGWANRLVAKWCERRAVDHEAHKHLTRCRHAYKTGSLAIPVRLFADVLESQLKANEAEWRKMAKLFRDAADREAQQHAELRADNGRLEGKC